jgi:hypothetical protein
MSSRALVLGLVAAVAMAGCGKQNPNLIPSDQSDQITSEVDAAQNAISSQDCRSARDALKRAARDVAHLKARSHTLRVQLGALVSDAQSKLDQCHGAKTPTPTPSDTASPTLTPTATAAVPTATATASASPSPSPTPSASASPSATSTSTTQADASPQGTGGVSSGDG